MIWHIRAALLLQPTSFSSSALYRSASICSEKPSSQPRRVPNRQQRSAWPGTAPSVRSSAKERAEMISASVGVAASAERYSEAANWRRLAGIVVCLKTIELSAGARSQCRDYQAARRYHFCGSGAREVNCPTANSAHSFRNKLMNAGSSACAFAGFVLAEQKGQCDQAKRHP